MKRIIWIIGTIIYLFSANALVHAATMEFFDHQQNTISDCHQTHTTNQTTSNKNNIDCCELVYSNEYSTTKIDLKTFCQKYFPLIEITNIDSINIKKNWYTIPTIEGPPWRKIDNKFNNFSDLVWIIVNLI